MIRTTTRALALALTLCLMLASLSAFAAVATAGGLSTAVVNNPNPEDRLNLRTEPRTSAPSLGKYYSGVTVTLHDISSNYQGEWAYVSIGEGQRGSQSGYMQTKYLVFGGAPVRSAIPVYAVGASAWALYDSPNRRSASRTMGAESAVEVLGISGAWWHIRVRGLYGYVPADSSGLPASGAIGTTANVNNPNPSDRLHLRTAPYADAPSLGKYYNGVTVEILPYSSDTWCRVRIGSTEGYMMKRYLTSASVRSAIPTMIVSNPNPKDRLNLRSGMSDKSDSLGKFYNGTRVEVLGIGETWHHVRVNGTIGYMMKQYLK